MPSLTEIDGSMKALRNVTRIVVLNLPQLSLLSLRASLLNVNEVEMENAGLFEKSDELKEGLRRMKENEEKREMAIKKKSECLRRFLSWMNILLCLSVFVLLIVLYCGNGDVFYCDRNYWDRYRSAPNYVIITLYALCWLFTLFLLIYELHIKGLDVWLRRKCRFLFTYIGRAILLLWGLVFLFHV